MNAVSGGILFLLLLVVALAQRRWALLAILGGVFYLTQGHSLVVAGLNIYTFRILELAAFGRVIIRGELTRVRLNKIDWTLLLAYNYAAAIWILRSSDVSPQQFASAVDPTLVYLALRSLVTDLEDLRWLLGAFLVLLVPYGSLVFLERLTGRSAFSLVGASWSLYFRDGVPRCMGSFRHAILLGSVAASFLALYIGVFMSGRRRVAALLGAGVSLMLVALSHSGGPLTTAIAVFLGWAAWPLRRHVKWVRRGILAVLVLLLIFMKAPIWYLPFKISAVVGGGGYHRGLLMDQAWQDLGRWWLAGLDVTETSEWMPYVHTDIGGADVTNQFVVFGLRGGLIALGLLVAVFVFALRNLGRPLSAAQGSGLSATEDAPLLWGLGVAVLSHAVSWLGVAYFDQSYVVWLLQLAAVSSCVQAAAASSDRFVPAAEGRPRRGVRYPSVSLAQTPGDARRQHGKSTKAWPRS